MKLTSNANTWKFGLLLSAIVSFCALACQKGAPVSSAEFIGAWSGFDQNKLIFCRLELDTEGKGFCTTSYVDDPPQLYAISQWSLKENLISVELKPIDEGAERIYLRGPGGLTDMVLEIGGIDVGWKRQITLINEKKFLLKNIQAKDRIARHKIAR